MVYKPIETDQSLRAKIIARLMADRRIRTETLRVGVLNWIVHLAGKVESEEIRRAAEEVAWQVSGVRGVVNRIEAPGAPEPGRTIDIIL